MTYLESELLAGLRAATAALKVYSNTETPLLKELERIQWLGILAETRDQREAHNHGL